MNRSWGDSFTSRTSAGGSLTAWKRPGEWTRKAQGARPVCTAKRAGNGSIDYDGT